MSLNGDPGPEDCHQAKVTPSPPGGMRERTRADSGALGAGRQNHGEGRPPRWQSLTLACPHPRIARATEALQTFRPAASSSFRHCQLDVGREMKLLTELNFLRGEEMARPRAQLEPFSLLPQQRARGAVPTGDPPASRPASRPARPATPRS